MSKRDNFFQRAFNALIEGRTREAERYVAQFDRDYPRAGAKVNKR